MIQQTIDTITSGSTDSKLAIVSIAHRLSTVRRADVIYVDRVGVSLVEILGRLEWCLLFLWIFFWDMNAEQKKTWDNTCKNSVQLQMVSQIGWCFIDFLLIKLFFLLIDDNGREIATLMGRWIAVRFGIPKFVDQVNDFQPASPLPVI